MTETWKRVKAYYRLRRDFPQTMKTLTVAQKKAMARAEARRKDRR